MALIRLSPFSVAALGFALLVLASTPHTAAAQAAADSRQAIEAAIATGDALFASGQAQRALAEWAHAQDLIGDTGTASDRIAVLARRAEAEQSLGRFGDAVRTLDRAVAVAQSAKDAAATARLRGALGRAHYLAGDRDASRKHLDACLGYAAKSGNTALQAATLNDLGNLLTGENPGQARASYAQAFELATTAGDDVMAATARLNEARALLDNGDAQSAERVLQSALSALHALPDSRHKSLGLVSAGTLYA